MLTKTYLQDRDLCAVTFTIPSDQLPQYFDVRSAAVVADFNNWSIMANPMTFVEGVGYQATVELSPNQTYEYRYVLNDVAWYNDWAADGYVPNRLQNADNCVCSLESMVANDLTKVSGIGPKIMGLLNDDGIRSYGDLAKASVERLEAILAAAGSRYQMAVPITWPQQAAYAAAGQWDELSAYQATLDGGKPK